MGSRVEASTNDVVEVNGEDVVFCAYDGDMAGDPPQGYAPVDYAESHWVDVNRQLACTVYCAAKLAGLSEEKAQLARAMKTRMEMRAEGRDAEADYDEWYINDIMENPENHPSATPLAEVASPKANDHGVEAVPTVEQGVSDDDWEEIRKALEGEEE